MTDHPATMRDFRLEVIEAWREGTGHHIYEGYGQTESVLVAATFPATPWKPGSMGPAAPGHHLAIVGEDGHERRRGEEGELAIRVKPDRPLGMFQEYWKNAEATAKCHRGDWYITGDRASMDDQGYLWFVGRADDVINSASDALAAELQEHVKKVTAPYKYPREIEFVADLPKTISGKIRRTELRQMERDRSSKPPLPAKA